MFCFPPTYPRHKHMPPTSMFASPTLSRSNLQTSADPAFVTGITLISLALRTSLAVVDVNKESRLTFHFVVSQVKDCSERMEPAQTNVHSDPLMYVLYRSSER